MKWFKHLTIASSDFKILDLERVYGHLGYAFYWKLVEFIAGQWSGYGSPEIETTMTYLRQILRSQGPKVSAVLQEMKRIGLIDYMIDGEKLIIRIDALKEIKDNSTSRKTDNRGLKLELKEYIVKRDNNLCSYCSKTLFGQSLNFDHFIPISSGGKSVASNIVLSCDNCNKIKHMKHPDDIEKNGGIHSSVIARIREKLSLELDKEVEVEVEVEEEVEKDILLDRAAKSETPEKKEIAIKRQNKSVSKQAPVQLKTLKDFYECVGPEICESWFNIYKSKEFIEKEVLKSFSWLLANPNKATRSPRGWKQFYTNWFSKAIDSQSKTGISNKPSKLDIDNINLTEVKR